MKKIIKVLALCLLFVQVSKAGEKEDVIELVNRWNSLHNSKQVSDFVELYADSVLYYGKYRSGEQCFRGKQELLDMDFEQAIVGPLEVTLYSSGVFKCTFTKKVTSKGRTKEYPSYLLVKKEEGRYRITGESDMITDKNLKVHLDLGTVVVAGGGSKTVFFVIGILFIAGLAGLVIYRKKKRVNTFAVDQPVVTASYGISDVEAPAAPVVEAEQIVATVKEAVLREIKTATSEREAERIEVEKGIAFEKYVVSKFTPEYFELVEWRGDKYHEGVYATSSHLPDLEYHFKTRSEEARFAVECKWRSGFVKGRIEWAKSYQLVNYRQYERDRGMRVFVVIGMGGVPEAPESVFIVPLSDIRSNVLTEEQLKKYARRRQGNFYLNGGMLL